MELKPDIKINKEQNGENNYYVGVKGSITFEELGKWFRKYILRKKEFPIDPPKKKV
jgi:hypothetical protein